MENSTTTLGGGLHLVMPEIDENDKRAAEILSNARAIAWRQVKHLIGQETVGAGRTELDCRYKDGDVWATPEHPGVRWRIYETLFADDGKPRPVVTYRWIASSSARGKYLKIPFDEWETLMARGVRVRKGPEQSPTGQWHHYSVRYEEAAPRRMGILTASVSSISEGPK